MVQDSALKDRASIIVRDRDEERFLGECLEAINAQSHGDREIILVYDIRSTDRTLEIATSHNVRVVEVAEDKFCLPTISYLCIYFSY